MANLRLICWQEKSDSINSALFCQKSRGNGIADVSEIILHYENGAWGNSFPRHLDDNGEGLISISVPVYLKGKVASITTYRLKHHFGDWLLWSTSGLIGFSQVTM